MIETYNHLIPVGPAGVGCSHGGGATLAVPWEVAALRSAADGQRVDGVDVAVAVAVVAEGAAVARRPHVDRAPASSTLPTPTANKAPHFENS